MKDSEDTEVLIEPPPTEWHDLQDRVAAILVECGLVAESPKTIQTVRGAVEVDVFALDPSQNHQPIYLIECKCWKSRVSKGVIQGFRTVLEDFGANWGIIISSAGFQIGAFDAAQYTNLRLLDWEGFNQLFLDRWIRQFLGPLIYMAAGPLVEYTEPINSRIFRKADALSSEAQSRFRELRQKYAVFAFTAMIITLKPTFGIGPEIEIPILGPQIGLEDSPASTFLPEDVLASAYIRQFGERLVTHLQTATAEFDALFGERA